MTDQRKLRIKGIKYFAKVKGLTFAAAERYYDVDSLICACGAPKGRTHKACPPCAKVRCEESRAKYLETHREQERRGDRIRWRMKAGMTRQEAEAMEAPIGVCKCGKQARRANGRICKDCYQAKDREAKRGKPSRMVAKVCATCGGNFTGTSNAKYCSLHKGGVKAKKVPARPVLPQTWEKPVVEKRPAQIDKAGKLTEAEAQLRIVELKRQEQANIAAAMALIEEQRAQRVGFKRGVDREEIDVEKERAYFEVMERMARR
jgi:hypothetical protein